MIWGLQANNHFPQEEAQIRQEQLCLQAEGHAQSLPIQFKDSNY